MIEVGSRMLAYAFKSFWSYVSGAVCTEFDTLTILSMPPADVMFMLFTWLYCKFCDLIWCDWRELLIGASTDDVALITREASIPGLAPNGYSAWLCSCVV